MAHHHGIINIGNTLWIKTSVINWIIVTLGHELYFGITCPWLFCFLFLCPWHLLKGADSMDNWNLFILQLVNNDITNVEFVFFPEYEYISSIHTRLHGATEHNYHWTFISKEKLDTFPHAKC